MLVRLGLLVWSLVFATLLVGCSDTEGSGGAVEKSGDWQKFVDELEEAGFFKYLPREEVVDAKTWIVSQQYLYDEASGRAFAGDAERMAEGGVLAFLYDASPFLKRQGVSMIYMDQELSVEHGKFEYTVLLNLDKYKLFETKDLESVGPWAIVPTRAFDMVNKLLERAKSPERIYMPRITLAESAIAVFLTPDLYRMINNSDLIADEDKLMTVEELLEIPVRGITN